VYFTGAASYLQFYYAVAQYCDVNCGDMFWVGVAKEKLNQGCVCVLKTNANLNVANESINIKKNLNY
jgi:hypothetical protein